MSYKFNKRTCFGVALTLALTGIGCFAQDQTSTTSNGGWRRFDPSTQVAPAPNDGSAAGSTVDQGGQQVDPTGQPAPPRTTASVPPEITIPAGTWITVRMNEPLSSKHNHPGDSYSATLVQPLVADGYVVARRGQSLAGRVADSGAKGGSHLSLELTDLTLIDGQQMPVRTELARFEAGSTKGRDAVAIGTTAGVGAAIGAAVAGGVGAAAGAGIGAIASAGVLTSRGHETVVLPEDRLTFRTTAPITISTARAAQVFQPVQQSDYEQPRPMLQRRVGAPPPYGYSYGPYGPYGAYGYPYPYYYGPGFYGPYIGFYGRFGGRW